MKCPNCGAELVQSPIVEEPEPPVALAPQIIMETRCPKCGYTGRDRISGGYTEVKTCPKCKQEKYVVKKKDTKAITKVGYFYYCMQCKLDFPAKWVKVSG